MFIVLSQRIDIKSDYNDQIFSIYHYPKTYKNSIHTDDIFIYYQGDKSNRDHRYYYGTGVVGEIWGDGEDGYYASLIHCRSFSNRVPIYHDSFNYIELLGTNSDKLPAWQRSIRPLTEDAYKYILDKAGLLISENPIEAFEEQQILNSLNDNYISPSQNFSYVPAPEPRGLAKVQSGHLVFPRSTRKASNALSRAEYRCEVDPTHRTFSRKKGGIPYTEPHHLIPMSASERFSNSLDVEANIVSLCSHCHNLIHYGKEYKTLISQLYDQRKTELEKAGLFITEDDLIDLY